MEDGEEEMKIAMLDKERLPKLHEVQWQILKKMALSAESRYNELKPKIMDPKRFTYHLNKLRVEELIYHDEERGVYLLTERAKTLIAYFTDIPSWGTLSLNGGIMLYIKRGGKILTVKRDRQPFLGYTGILYLAPQKNDFLQETAQRALAEIGLQGKVELGLIVEILFKNAKEEVVRHALMLTYIANEPEGEVKSKSYEGKLEWMSPNELLVAKPGYDNTNDLVEFFERQKQTTGIQVISKIYHTPM